MCFLVQHIGVKTRHKSCLLVYSDILFSNWCENEKRVCLNILYLEKIINEIKNIN